MRLHAVLLLVPSLVLACVPESSVDVRSSSVAPQPDPAGSRHWSKVSEPLPVPHLQTATPLEIEWFRGVKELPAGHPCHDDANIVYMDDDLECEPAQLRLSSASLGALRKRADTDWAHIGPRRVRGARWTVDGQQHMVVTCDMAGAGFSRYDGGYLGHPGDASESHPWILDERKDRSEPAFVVDAVSETNDIEATVLQFASRSPGEADWRMEGERYRQTNSDEGNNPQFAASTWLLDVKDSDGDRIPEVTAVIYGDCRRFHAEACPEVSGRWTGFTVQTLVREGDAERSSLTFLGESGAVIERPVDAGPVDSLTALLLDAEPRALETARANLRAAGKLR